MDFDKEYIGHSKGPKKEISFKPGIQPGFDNKKDHEAWNEKYNSLSREDKILLETQEQTRLLTRISTNVAFFVWLTVFSIGFSLFAMFILPNL